MSAAIKRSRVAAELAEWVGVNPADDVARIRSGLTRESLLAECLDGAEPENVDGWREYVSHIMAAAENTAPTLRIYTTAPLSEAQRAGLLDYVKADPNNGARTVAFELGEALSVDCPDEYFGAEVLAQVVRLFTPSELEGGAS